MIAKVIYGSGFYGVFAYAESKKEGLSVSEKGIEDRPGFERLSVNNFDDGRTFFSTKAQLADSLKRWTMKSKRVEKGVFHASIALPPGEHLSNEAINKLACAYMRKMGYGENPFVIYKHNDTHHAHVHIISSRVGEKGRVINPSFEFKKNLKVCRELEQEFGLRQLSNIKQKEQSGVQPIEAHYSKKTPFKQNVLQNLAYAVTIRKIPSLEELSEHMRKKGIEVVYANPDGSRFPNAGVIFYRLSGEGERESRLKGWNFGKGFGKRLERGLAKNAAPVSISGQPIEAKVALPFPEQLKISNLLHQLYDDLIKRVSFSEQDLLNLASHYGLQLSIKHNKAGFNGFSIIHNEEVLKPSDFSYQSIKLSSTFIKPRLSQDTQSPDDLPRFVAHLREQSTKLGMANGSEFLRFLNRHGLHCRAVGEDYQLYMTDQPKRFFIVSEGHELWNVLRGTSIGQPLQALDFNQLNLYHALLQNDVNSLAKLSRHKIDFHVHTAEGELEKGLGGFRTLVDMQNRLRVCLTPDTGQLMNNNFATILQKMNNRGLHLSVEEAGGQVKGIIVTDLLTGQQLNRFTLIYPFNNLVWLKSHLPSQEILSLQQIDRNKALIFNHYERTGAIQSEQFALLQSDPLYRNDLMKVYFRYNKLGGDRQPSKNVRHPNLPGGDTPSQLARGESDVHYGRVYNNTIFHDLWDTRSKGI